MSPVSARGVLSERAQDTGDELGGFHKRLRPESGKFELEGHERGSLEVRQWATPPSRLAHYLLGQEGQCLFPHKGTREGTPWFADGKGGDLIFAAMGEDVQPGPDRDGAILVRQVLRVVAAEERFAINDQFTFPNSASSRQHLVRPRSPSLQTCCDSKGALGRAERHK